MRTREQRVFGGYSRKFRVSGLCQKRVSNCPQPLIRHARAPGVEGRDECTRRGVGDELVGKMKERKKAGQAVSPPHAVVGGTTNSLPAASSQRALPKFPCPESPHHFSDIA